PHSQINRPDSGSPAKHTEQNPKFLRHCKRPAAPEERILPRRSRALVGRNRQSPQLRQRFTSAGENEKIATPMKWEIAFDRISVERIDEARRCVDRVQPFVLVPPPGSRGKDVPPTRDRGSLNFDRRLRGNERRLF